MSKSVIRYAMFLFHYREIHHLHKYLAINQYFLWTPAKHSSLELCFVGVKVLRTIHTGALNPRNYLT